MTNVLPAGPDVALAGDSLCALACDPEMLRILLEYSSEVLTILDASGTIRYSSPATQRVLGLRPDELNGKGIFGLIHPHDVPAVIERLQSVLEASGAVRSIQCRIRRSDGSWRVVGGVLRNLLQVEAVAGVLLSARDITDRKRLEDEFHHARRLKALGQLTGGVAHEFSNLLSVILCYGEMALGALEAGNPLRADLEEVCRAAERGAGLVAQLLSFGSPRAASPQYVDLNRLVTNMVHMLAPILDEHIQVTSALAPDLGTVRVDPRQIDQVLLNLALNARDAMPSGGAIRIETGNVARGSGSECVLLTFSDTGQGMDACTRSRIFDPFFTTKGKGEGTGLGLSTVRSIILRYGGTISVESEPLRGTTFRISLPRAVADLGLQPAA